MANTSLAGDDRHDCILVILAPGLVLGKDGPDIEVAHYIAHNEHKVALDDLVRIDVSHRCTDAEHVVLRYNRHDLDWRVRA